MRRRAILGWAGLPSMVSCGLVALGAAGCAPSSPVTHVTERPAPSQPSPQRPGGDLLDLSWVSDSSGWALFEAPCAAGSCAHISRTQDGGLTWSRLPDPPASIAPALCDACIAHVRFVDAQDGYLFGPALFVTHDGGQHWLRQASLPVEALEPSHGVTYRVVYDHGGCPGPCTRTVQISTNAQSWRTVDVIPFDPSLPSRQDAATLVMGSAGQAYVAVFGDAAAGSKTQEAVIHRSLNGGSTWSRLADPCISSVSATDIAINVAAAPGSVLSVLCLSRSAATPGYAVASSGDAGSTWGAVHSVPGVALGLFAAGSGSRLVVATAPTSGTGVVTYVLESSQDGGAHWSVAAGDSTVLDFSAPAAGFLGFEDATVGRWIGDQRYVWTTHDGGSTWTRSSVF